MNRYQRQMAIRGFGREGQRRLEQSCVLVVGLGGLGCSASLYLAAAGVGSLMLLDPQRVEPSNLNRQVLHWDRDVGKLKAESAREKLLALNPQMEVETREEKATSRNLGKLVEKVDVVVDGTDNYAARYLLNEACARSHKPLVHGAVEGFLGQVTTILPGRGPCLRCIFPRPPPEKKSIPVLGATAGLVGCLEAMETIKLLTGLGRPLVGRLLIFDGESMHFEEVRVEKREDCPVCSVGGRK
jgi:molybdopterin/thiamine biosynthesis adenylyltransferase